MTPEKFPAPTILIVDDEALIRWSLAEGLSRQGYNVAEAADGHSALRWFAARTDRVGLVFLDVRLPDCDDLRILKAIKQTCPACPVILMTAYGTPALLEAALAMGAYEVVEKPFDVNSMVRLAVNALGPQAGPPGSWLKA